MQPLKFAFLLLLYLQLCDKVSHPGPYGPFKTYQSFIVTKFNLRKADLIRLGQVWLLLFLLISLFIYFNLGLRFAIEKKIGQSKP